MSTNSETGAVPLDPPTDFVLAAAIRTLTREFHGQIDELDVTQVVHDCHRRLIAHVPRTLHLYLTPWARARLHRRMTSRHEPTLSEVLAAPAHRL